MSNSPCPLLSKRGKEIERGREEWKTGKNREWSAMTRQRVKNNGNKQRRKAMRKGLLMSAAGLLLAGSGTAYGACTPVLDCASLGYKYSSSECSGSGVACPFDTSKYFCAEPCTYTVTKATCDSQCKNVGDKACTKNGTVYYESCGSSKCNKSVFHLHIPVIFPTPPI